MERNISVFDYLDYRDFLIKFVKSNSKTYGFKAKCADAAGCQRSFFSQVLNGSAHFTPEHAFGLTTYWEMDSNERDHFLDLVSYARAGDRKWKDFLRNKIETAKRERENIVKRIAEKTVLESESAAIFYSNWQYLAITILLTIPRFRSLSSIAQRLDLKEELVARSLQDLERLGLVVKNGREWAATQSTIHLPRDSQFNSLNHSHWRQKGVQNSFLADPTSVHYTSVCSVSLTDAEKLKAMVFNLIDESRRVIAPSPEEELFCLTCDWFKV